MVGGFQPVTVGLAKAQDLGTDRDVEEVLDRSAQVHALQAHPYQVAAVAIPVQAQAVEALLAVGVVVEPAPMAGGR